MNEQENTALPELRTSTDIMNEELSNYWLDPTKDYPEPHFMFEYNGVGFSPLGGIQAISGQKKNGKTFVLAQLMAVALADDNERVKFYLKGLTTRKSTIDKMGHLPVVLYCDTEMEQLNTAKVLRRVHWLCGWDMRQKSERFHVLWLREVPKVEQGGKTISANKERWRVIKNAIEVVNPDLVFIDGLRDLVDDFNDNKESSEMVGEMMSLASQKQCCIWNVLHMNPRPGADDESKMRGHLGTELGNKVSDTFTSSKKKDANGVVFTVKQLDARGKDVDDWQFEVCDAAGGLGIPRILGGTEVKNLEENKAKQDRDEADKYFKAFPRWTRGGVTYVELERFIRTKGETSNRKISNLFNVALESGIIAKNTRNKYIYIGLGNQLPDETNNLPFEKPTENDQAPF